MYSKSDPKRNVLAKTLAKLMARKRSPILQRRLDELTANAHQTPTKAAARGGKQKGRKLKADALLSSLREEHHEWCMRNYPSYSKEERQARFDRGQPAQQKTHPYPGLANLGNTCYVSAVCQALLHCDAARSWLATGIEAASVADDEAREFLKELQKLGRTLLHGIAIGLTDATVHFDM